MRRLLALLVLTATAAVLFGCGGSGGVKQPTISAAHTFQLENFAPSGEFTPGHAHAVTFKIEQPSGQPLTQFKRGSGPHTGVHLIYVRDDLGAIVHHHPPIDASGTIHDNVTFPTPGHYKMLVDVYPAHGPLPNFQLSRQVAVKGAYKPKPLPAATTKETVDGYTFTLPRHVKLRAAQPGFMPVTVRGPNGKPPAQTPWYGALAHAIFFRKGSLDYFHTHICGAGASALCTSRLGAANVTGHSAKPGQLTVGVLLPIPGTWRLFLQSKLNGQVVTAPFTLNVS